MRDAVRLHDFYAATSDIYPEDVRLDLTAVISYMSPEEKAVLASVPSLLSIPSLQ